MAARLDRDQAPSPHTLGRAEVETMLDYLDDVWEGVEAGDAGEAG